ncbi:MAG: hypothetical protein ACTHJ5_01135 [Ilyomonas sp.]
MKRAASLCLIAVFIFLSCNTSDAVSGRDNSGPAIATEQFFKALNDKDFASAKKHVSKESSTFIDMLDSFYRKNKKDSFFTSKDFSVSNVQIKGDSASADLKTQTRSPMKVRLVKESDEWKVAFDMNDLMKNVMDDSHNTKSRNMDYDIHKGIDSVRKGL